MYTQCPECETAFRVTAEVLQKAGGRVRCGGCGNAFSAIEYLSEQLPNSDDQDDDHGEDLSERSNALLETLDKLAGDDDVRIEDTGTEWRVLTEDEAEDGDVLYQDTGVHEQVDDASGAQSSLDLADQQAAAAERRYDDNTPLPDDFEDEEDVPYTPPPQRRASDEEADTDFDKFQVDLELGEDGDWEDLLAEEAADEAEATPAAADDVELETSGAEQDDNADSDLIRQLEAAEAQQLEEDSAVLPQLVEEIGEASDGEIAEEIEDDALAAEPEIEAAATEITDTSASGSIPADIDTQFNLQALAMGLEISRNDELETEDADDPAATAAGDDEELLTAADLEALTLEEPPEQPAAETPDETVQELLQDVAEDDDETLNRELEAFAEAESGDEITETDDAADAIDAIASSDIVGKLRQSTGSFQKQIEAAQQALEDGEIEDAANAAAEIEQIDLADATVAHDPHADADEHIEELAEELAEELELEAEPDADEEAEEEPDEEPDEEPLETLELVGEDEDEDEDEDELADDAELEELAEENLAEEDLAEEDLAEEDLAEEDLAEELDEELAEEDTDDDLAAASEDPEDLLSQTMIQAGIDPAALDSDNVETIVMEGEFVRGSLEKERLAEEAEVMAQFEDAGSLADTYMLNKGKVKGGRRRGDPASTAVIGIVVALVLLLAGQYIHASRESLVEYGAFNQTLGPVYRALGHPITPQWDIKGWQFRKTDGSVDESGQLLTISSRVQNVADKSLPYPLVHVSLTDRWEEIIGSRVLGPADYLAGDLDPSQPVSPGNEFTAVIAIESPAPEATGYKVNVCYRVDAERVRCATEDFKNR